MRDRPDAGSPPPRMLSGPLAAALAYILWGLFPLYIKQISTVAPLEIVAHRSVGALVVVVLLLAAMRRLGAFKKALTEPRTLAVFALSALLLSVNWLIYVWAVNNGRILDASLGYFINPLVNVVLGYLFLGERLRPAQWVAISLAAAGVLWLIVGAGQWPWVALALAATFGLYGLLRKTAPLGALEGLGVETLLQAPIALSLLLWWTWHAQGALVHADPSTLAWLLVAGPFTAVPLLLFAFGARRLTLATLGVLQYLGPTLQFLIGVWVYDEPFSADRAVGFVLIWSALLLYTAEGWRRR